MAQMQQTQQGGPLEQPHQTETLEQVQLHLARQQEQTMKQKEWWQQQLTIAKGQRQKLHCC